MEAEARIHGGLDHPHIIPLLLSFEDSQHIYLAITHADGGDLRQLLDQRGPMSEQRVREWLVVPLLLALVAVHDQVRAGVVMEAPGVRASPLGRIPPGQDAG